jgi:hypothetical protein
MLLRFLYKIPQDQGIVILRYAPGLIALTSD